MKLCSQYLDSGRVIVTDNFYTSLELAHKLIEKKTHLIGTLRKSRKDLPRSVILAKLERGEIFGLENRDGIVVAKWKDKRDVLMLSTCHGLEIETTGKKNRQGVEAKKPKMIIDYNGGKGGVDVSDQLSSFSSSLRKTVRWYHKVAMELLLGTACVNAYLLYRSLPNSKKMTITEFRESIVESMLGLGEETGSTQATVSRKHELQQTEVRDKRNRKIRKRCTYCYDEISKVKGSRKADRLATKMTTFCSACPKKPFMCLKCFTSKHSKRKFIT